VTEQIVYTIPQVQEIAKTGRTKLYEEINAGRLNVCKVGRKTLVTHDQLRDWLRRCEVGGDAAPTLRVRARAEAPKTEPLHDEHVKCWRRAKRAAKAAAK
jgi:transposase-like protein